MVLDANRRGILAMSAAMACFIANDAMVKYVSQTLPSFQLIFLRGAFSTMFLACALAAMGAWRHLAALRNGRVMLRAAIDALATVAYLTSLFYLPIGNATAINMATPLFLTLFAAVALNERVQLGRWLAIATGFAGVLLIVQPRAASFNAYVLLCLTGTVLHASRDLATRLISQSVPSIVITFSTAIAVTLLTGAGTLSDQWHPVSEEQLALLALAGALLSAGYFLLTISMREGELSVVGPFRYTGLLFALLLGYVVWGDVPHSGAWAGIEMLLCAGHYVAHSQRARPRELEAGAD
jgi:drug/metabolite transporter (DMT)-like permease